VATEKDRNGDSNNAIRCEPERQTMGNPEPSPKVLKSTMDAVQRVDVGRLELIEVLA